MIKKYRFSASSREKLDTCDVRLQMIMHDTLRAGYMDFTIVCGHRNKEDQNEAFASGKSRVKWPDGKHNKFPSMAVDAVPWVNGALSYDYYHCCFLAGMIIGNAYILNIPIRWGGDWDMKGIPVTGQLGKLQDLGHYELID